MSLKVVRPNTNSQTSLGYQQSFLFHALVRLLGYTAAQSVVSYVCVSTGTPKSEFFSSYENFSKLLTLVYGDAAQRLVLDKFPNTRKTP